MKNTENTTTPRPVGPYSLSRRVDTQLYCSGQIGIVPDTGVLETASFEEEVRQALTNMTAVLRESGCTWADVVRTELYLTDMRLFDTVNTLYAEYVQEDALPARVTLGVAELPKQAHFEIACIAQLSNQPHHD